MHEHESNLVKAEPVLGSGGQILTLSALPEQTEWGTDMREAQGTNPSLLVMRYN